MRNLLISHNGQAGLTASSLAGEIGFDGPKGVEIRLQFEHEACGTTGQ